MTREDRILALCARQDFTPRHLQAVEELCGGGGVRWDRLAAAAGRHGVLPIVGANLRRCDPARTGLPADLAARFELAVLENAAVRERDADRLAAGLVRLLEVELEAMLLKGTALALAVYEEPWVVTSQDIDLVLRPGPGWEKGKGEEKAVRRALYTNGVECDLETHHDVTMNGVLPVDFPRIWREARPVRFRGVPAWTMSPEDLLISLAVNCNRKHFRLKGLFDVAETLRRGEAIDWRRLGDAGAPGALRGDRLHGAGARPRKRSAPSCRRERWRPWGCRGPGPPCCAPWSGPSRAPAPSSSAPDAPGPRPRLRQPQAGRGLEVGHLQRDPSAEAQGGGSHPAPAQARPRRPPSKGVGFPREHRHR